ncbi:hypothetical protein FUAX_42690 (plasmid) [Fulvitalea axinellae]|uniref:Uncharacterized protein n=1 Tax=Fulvitalea axinellae TaxID=1182444 RepID=A0AAU9CXX7_9BACT|nr:hypothetical protein FUAX_42690 [Fulvitalea axinellae]
MAQASPSNGGRGNGKALSPPLGMERRWESPVQLMRRSLANFSGLNNGSSAPRDAFEEELVAHVYDQLRAYTVLEEDVKDYAKLGKKQRKELLRLNFVDRIMCLDQIEDLAHRWTGLGYVAKKTFYGEAFTDAFSILLSETHTERVKIFTKMHQEGLGATCLPKPPERLFHKGKKEEDHIALRNELFSGHLIYITNTREKNEKDFRGLVNAMAYQLMRLPTGWALMEDYRHHVTKQLHLKLWLFPFDAEPDSRAPECHPESKKPSRGAGGHWCFPKNMSASRFWCPFTEGASRRDDKLATYPPYHLFAELIRRFMSRNLKQSERYTQVLTSELDAKLRDEAGMPHRAQQRFLFRDDDTYVDIDMDEQEESEAAPNVREMVSSFSSLGLETSDIPESGLRGAYGVPEARFGLQPPVEFMSDPRLQAFAKVFFGKPEFKFSQLQKMGFPNIFGRSSNLFTLTGNAGHDAVVKFSKKGAVRVGRIEKEILANNLVRLLGRNVTAPGSQALHPLNGDLAQVYYDLKAQPTLEPVFEAFVQAVSDNLADPQAVTGMLCERVPGTTIHQQFIESTGLMSLLLNKNPAWLRAIGELAAYNLMMGNGDGAMTVLNPGNLFASPQSSKVTAIDQTVCLFDMLVIISTHYPEATASIPKDKKGSYKGFQEALEEPAKHPQELALAQSIVRKYYPKLVSRFIKELRQGKVGDNLFCKSFTVGCEKYFSPFVLDLRPYSLGLAEGLLQISEQANIRNYLEKWRYMTFGHEMDMMFENWRTIENIVDGECPGFAQSIFDLQKILGFAKPSAPLEGGEMVPPSPA